MTATRLLEEQGVDIKTHDIVTTSSGDQLANHAVVTVQSAYQTTINIDGTSVPFWTVATSADQLLGFFEENQNNAAKITVDIKNVYNQLTGGLVINQSGPVTVIADGKSSVAPNGKLPAASILDSKGIVLNKEDRVSVEKDSDETILRVRRVTHGEETRTSVIPFSTQTIIDPNLAEGQADVRQQGVNGEKTQVYDVTYVDGVAESETLKSETVTSMAIDQIIAVGAAKSDTDKGPIRNPTPPITARPIPVPTISTSRPTTMPATPAATTPATPAIPVTLATPVTPANSGNTGNTGGGTNNNSGSSGSDSGTTPTPSGRLWHATVAQAQAYAAGAAAQRGWTGNDWDCLVKLWNRESRWLWYAENASSGATAFLSRYQQTKWLRSAPITVTMPPYRSIGVCGTSHKPTAARPRHGKIPNKSVGTDRLRSPQGTHAYERHHSRHRSPVRRRRYPSYRGRCRHQPHQEIRAELRHRPRHGPSYRTRGGSDRCRSCHGSRPRPGMVDAGDFGNRVPP